MEDWTEKYRPKTLTEVIGNKKAVLTLKRWADSWKNGIPKKRAVILTGKPGIGKTSVAHALGRDYGWTVIELNASDARNAKIIKAVATAGAMHETFTDNGVFLSSQQGKRKLIILDEADHLYDSVKTGGTSRDAETVVDYSDKGGKKAIVNTIKNTQQPIILIVNDFYGLIKGGGEPLKQLCLTIQFYPPYPNETLKLLKKICHEEEKQVDITVLRVISDQCSGDIRSAINDLQSICLNKKQVDAAALQSLGLRDRSKLIFDVLRDIFLTTNIEAIRENSFLLDEDPKQMILWINENLPNAYVNLEDLSKGYIQVSTADVFLGRVHRRNHYELWSYACDLMTAGVALEKNHPPKHAPYSFPFWLKKGKQIKPQRDIRRKIMEKLSQHVHSSQAKTASAMYPYFQNMFITDDTFAVNIARKLELTEDEILFLLGKKHAHKKEKLLQQMASPEQKPIKTTIPKEPDTPQKNKKKEEDKRQQQQQKLLLDF